MTLSISPEIQKLIDEEVSAGRYKSAEEVIGAAMVNLAQQRNVATLTKSEFEVLYPGIEQKLAEGLADLKAGRVSDGDAFFDELEREDRAPH